MECADCRFVYLENAPAYECLASEFAWEKSIVEQTGRRTAEHPVMMWLERKTRWRLRNSGSSEARMLRRSFAPGRLLDVGCGIGISIPEPFTPFGIEVSDRLARIADERMALRGGRTIHAPARVMGARWCGFRYPDHVNYFTLASFGKMAAECGLRLKLLNALVLITDDSIKAVLRKY